MIQFSKIVAVTSLIILLGCGGGDNSVVSNKKDLEYNVSKESAADKKEFNNKGNSAEIERKLIKNGNVSFETFNLEKTRQNITDAIKKYNAYVSYDNEYKSTDRITNNINVRVPSKDFDNFLVEISKGVEKFDSKNISVNDVTEEFLDVEARLKSKKKLEERYLDLLNKTKSVKEIIEVERQLANVRSAIESIEGRLKYLQNKVSYSTLSITFYKEISVQSNFGRNIVNGFKNGINNIKWFFIGLVNIWPFILIILIIIFLIRRRIKKNKS